MTLEYIPNCIHIVTLTIFYVISSAVERSNPIIILLRLLDFARSDIRFITATRERGECCYFVRAKAK